MVRTSVRLPQELLTAAQKHARETGRTFTEFLAAALRTELRLAVTPARACAPLPTYKGDGVRPGVDLSDSAALEDLMTGR